jgi:hypothetical protein
MLAIPWSLRVNELDSLLVLQPSLFGCNGQHAKDVLLKTATKHVDSSGKASDLLSAGAQWES